MQDTYKLSLSSSKFDEECNVVANTLCEMGVSASVVPNRTIIKNDGVNRLENGCQIIFTEGYSHKAWENLQDRFGLKCGYLEVPGKYKGCIFDYHKESNCPNNKNKNDNKNKS